MGKDDGSAESSHSYLRKKAQELAANTARPGDCIHSRGTLGQIAIVPPVRMTATSSRKAR